MDTLHRLRIAIEGLQVRDEVDLVRTKSEILGLIDQLNIVQPDGDSKHHRLSPREREVMGMILNGQRLKEIAARLDISVKTVTTHRSRLLKKLSVEDNLGLYRYGIRNGFITV